MRFVAATNRDLEAEIERGTFRQDRFFCLNAISLVIPPVRERVGEIAGLARGSPPRSAGSPARVLGMSRRALVNRLDAWGVARPRKRPRR